MFENVGDKVWAYYFGLSGFYGLRQVPKVWYTLKFWYLSFKITQKVVFVKIQVCRKMFDFQIYVKIQRKLSIIYLADLIFSLISRHFIIEASYFTEWRRMHQRENKLFEKIQENSIKIVIEKLNQSDKLTRFSFVLSLIFKIGHFFDILQFWWFFVVGYFKS